MTRYCINTLVSSPSFIYYVPKSFVELVESSCDFEFWNWIGDFGKTKQFFMCARETIEKAGTGSGCFDCICEFSDISRLVGLEVPCCDGTCGRKKQISNNILKYLVEY
jgi:hypothetical protein